MKLANYYNMHIITQYNVFVLNMQYIRDEIKDLCWMKNSFYIYSLMVGVAKLKSPTSLFIYLDIN